ncbi:SIR2 family NAD-dependent protein deacylase [Vacuolonema iberomarrocanum]|uniref:SIR2 family NAD-dependent protein deacylase n=1 Tax=Vacuolonema iberomarrocanum TaxID=3454632 RepID=UPI003F6E3555
MEDVATLEAWEKDPRLVLDFYNMMRAKVWDVEPNPAHLAIAQLESKYNVVVITQNVDNLHERAGSTNIIHVHGEITKACSSIDRSLVYDLGDKPIKIGDTCEKGSQLRPAVVWFGEDVLSYDVARQHFQTAARVLVIGTSLSVYPVSRLVTKARNRAEKIIVSLEIDQKPFGYRVLREKATTAVPRIARYWLK